MCIMVDRIKKLMEYEGMTSAHFADYLEIGRAVMSHILNGRNKPSLEVINKIVSKIDYIDPNWLLTGRGNMLKEVQPISSSSAQEKTEASHTRDLFSDAQLEENEVLPTSVQNTEIYRKETQPKLLEKDNYISNNQRNISTEKVDKKITKIIIYYSDNTFETFNPEKML